MFRWSALAGNANSSTLNNQGSNANWWSSSVNSATNARNLNLNSSNIYPQNNNNKFNGFSVRCVQDIKLVPPSDLMNIFFISPQVSYSLITQKG